MTDRSHETPAETTTSETLSHAPRIEQPIWRHSIFRKTLLVAALLVTTRCVGLYAIPDEIGKEVRARPPRLELPTRIGEWSGKSVKVAPIVYEILQPDAVVQKRYTLPAKSGGFPTTVEALVVYSRDPKGLHSPVTCMRAAGWMISSEESREVKLGRETLAVNVLTGEQRERKSQIAYCFTDSGQAVSGRIATFAKMVAARFLRRRVGAVELQFAYDPAVLGPGGQFTPEMSRLMLDISKTVHRALAEDMAQPEDTVQTPRQTKVPTT